MPLDRTAIQKLAKHHFAIRPYVQYVKTLKKLKDQANGEQWMQKIIAIKGKGMQHKIHQMKVRSDIHSGGCPPCQYPKSCYCDVSGNNCLCTYGKIG